MYIKIVIINIVIVDSSIINKKVIDLSQLQGPGRSLAQIEEADFEQL